MSESSKSGRTMESYRTDKCGNPVAERTKVCAQALKSETDAFEVVIHDAETGRIGYRSKRSVVNDRMLGVARKHGYEVDLISATSVETWDGELKDAVGIEFVPSAEVEDDVEMGRLVAELEEDVLETEVSDDE